MALDEIKIVVTQVQKQAQDMTKKAASVATKNKNADASNSGENAASTGTADMPTPTCPTLTRQQRLMGFGICFAIGYVLSFASTLALMLGERSATKFGITYSLGNIIALCGSGFIVGPKQQWKLMMKPVRRAATVAYLVLLVAALTVAIATPRLGGLVLVLVFMQFLAAIWYSASYIPYGRKIISKVCKNVCGKAVEW